MDTIHLQKAFAFIAKGLVEKGELLKATPNRYPYSRNLQKGMNMFLAACWELGGFRDIVFKYADESSFLSQYICKPICEWFDDWDQNVLIRLKIDEQPFYEYGPFACKRGKADYYTVTEECLEFLSTQESNIIEGTDEHALYEKIIQLTQDDYVKVRKYIIEHPVVSIENKRAFLSDYVDNSIAKDAFDLAYEIFEERYTICPSCGWTLVEREYSLSCISEYCLEHLSEIPAEAWMDASSNPVFRLRKGVMRYFAQPGKLEMEIAKCCIEYSIDYSLWPQKDKYDIEIRFSDGETWEIDAKAYHNAISLCSKIKKDGGFPSGDYKYGFYVVPTEYTKNKNNYTTIVNKVLMDQPNVKCVTLATLKKKIKKKVGELNEQKG